MRYRHLRRTVIATLATVAFVLLNGLVVRAVLETGPMRRVAAGWIESAARGIGVELEIADLHWDLLPPGVRLDGVRIEATGVAAEVESLRVDLGRIWLTRKTVELGTVGVRGAHVAMTGLPQEQRRRDPRLKISVRHLFIEDLRFEGTDFPGNLDVIIDGLRAGWSTEDGLTRGYADTRSVSVQPGKMPPFEGTVTSRFEFVDDAVKIPTVKIRGAGFDLRGAGRLEARKGLRIEVAGPVDLRWLDHQISTHGMLSGQVEISAVLDTDGSRLAHARVRSPHLVVAGFPLDGIDGDLGLEGRRLVGTLRRASFHGGVIRGEYELAEFGNAYPHHVRLTAEQVGLAGFLRNVGVPPAGLAAGIDVEAEGSWNGNAFGAGTGKATAILKPDDVGLPVAGRVNVDLTGEGFLRFDANALAIGGSQVQWQGALTLGSWEPEWTVRATPAAIEEIVPLVNSWVGSTVLPADLAGTGDLLVNLSGAFANLVVGFRLDAHRLTLPPIALDRMLIEATIASSMMRIGSARFQLGDGIGEVEGGLSWGAVAGSEQLDLGLRGRRLPLQTIASWIGLEGWTDDGFVSFTGNLRGPIVLPRGSWAVGFEDVRVAGVDLGGASTTIDLAQGLFECHQLRSEGGLEADFWWDVPGSIVGGKAEWPDMPLQALGENLTRFVGGHSDVRFEFRYPFEGRPTGNLSARSDRTTIDLEITDSSVHAEADLVDAAHASANLDRQPDGSLRGDGRIEVTSAGDLIELMAPGTGLPLTGSANADFSVEWADTVLPVASGLLQAIDVELDGRPVRLVEPARFSLDQTGFTVPGLRLTADEDEMFVRWSVGSNGRLTGNFSGKMDALLLRFLLADWEPAGKATGIVELSGTIDDPSVSGIAEIQNGSFKVPGTRTIFYGIDGTALFSKGEVQLDGTRFRFMEGRGSCSGRVWQRDESLNLRLAGTMSSLRFPVLPGFDARLSGSWQLVGPVDDLALTGDLSVDRTSLRRKDDVETLLLAWFAGEEAAGGTNGLRLDLHVEADETIEIRNPFVRLNGSASLDVTGTSSRPGLIGKIEFVEGGDATILGNRYELERGSITFSEPSTIDPFFNIQANTWVQNYQITVNLTGSADRIVPTVVANPPLSAPDIYSLLGVGYRDTALGESAVGLGLASSVISRELTSVLRSRAQLPLPVDQVRVDPFAADSTGNPTARLSVIKQITPAWTVILQSTLSGEREQIITSRWHLSPGLFLEAAQHEDGSLSLDLKMRRPY